MELADSHQAEVRKVGIPPRTPEGALRRARRGRAPTGRACRSGCAKATRKPVSARSIHDGLPRERPPGPAGGRLPAPAMLTLLFLLLAADWPQFLGPDRDGVYHGPPIVARAWASGAPPRALEDRRRAGLRRARRRRRPPRPLSSPGDERGHRRARPYDGSPALAPRVPDDLPRRLRLRRGAARGTRRGGRRRLHVRGAGRALRAPARDGRAALAGGYRGAVPGAQGLLRRRGIATRGGRPGPNESGWRGRGPRRVRREDRRAPLERDLGRGQLLFAHRRHLAGRPSRSSSPAPASSPWTPRTARSCTASTGGRARGPR